MTALLVGREQATLESVVTAVRDEGFAAHGTTVLAEATAELSSGRVTALVIGGGIGAGAREELREQGRAAGVPVVESGFRGRDATGYVREDIAPHLREAPASYSGVRDTAEAIVAARDAERR